jgi:hypothetical protein
MSASTIQEDFLVLRDQCMWTMKCYNNFSDLYEHDQTVDLLRYSAAWFFHDMNIVLQEYCLLQVGKLTDPVRSMVRENSTIPNLDARLQAESLWTHEIADFSANIMRYRDIIKDSRNRVIAHADKETFLQNLTVGAHAKKEMQDFFDNLNEYTDAVGNMLGVGALDYRVCPGMGDVTDLVSLLEDAHCRFAHTSEMNRLG